MKPFYLKLSLILFIGVIVGTGTAVAVNHHDNTKLHSMIEQAAAMKKTDAAKAMKQQAATGDAMMHDESGTAAGQ